MKKGRIPRREFLKVASAASVAGAGLTPALAAPAAAQVTPRGSAPSPTRGKAHFERP